MTRFITYVAVSCTVLFVLVPGAPPAHAGFPIRTVALKGWSAPGTSNTFDDLGLPVINRAGQVGFYADLGGGSVPNSQDEGYWAETDGGLRLAVREGDLMPGGTLPFTPDYSRLGWSRGETIA